MTLLDTPEPLEEWFNRQWKATPDEMFYKQASGRQIMFVHSVAALFNAGRKYEEHARVEVIATHTSKSVLLPVYSIERADGLRLVMRDNFYNWKLSVISERPIEADFAGLFHTTPPLDSSHNGNPLSPVYFEGFPRELVFGYYEPSDRRRFSAEIWGEHSLWTTIFLILRALGFVKPLRWSTG
ncbi:MAG TPA: hypothetical protein VGB13_04560 [Candidatus Krumholzibacteria bacterium]